MLMKNVSKIVIAPRASLGKFFMKSDSREMTSTVDDMSSREEHAYATGLVGLSTSLKAKQMSDLTIKAGAI